MDASSPTPACTVWWCGQDHADDPDHYAYGPWRKPTYATADVEMSGAPAVLAYPVWAAHDGLEPEVTVYVQGHKHADDLSLDLRPAEARQLAAHLLRAAAAAESPRCDLDQDDRPSELVEPLEQLADVIADLNRLGHRIDAAMLSIERRG